MFFITLRPLCCRTDEKSEKSRSKTVNLSAWVRKARHANPSMRSCQMMFCYWKMTCSWRRSAVSMSVEVKIGNDRSKDWCAVLRRFPHSIESSSNWDTARTKHSTAQYSFITSRWIMTLSFLRKTICSFFLSLKLLEHFFMFSIFASCFSVLFFICFLSSFIWCTDWFIPEMFISPSVCRSE